MEELGKDPYKCRFCSMKFAKSQALGGHMNRHRQEREKEQLEQAQELVNQKQHQPAARWNTLSAEFDSGAAATLARLMPPRAASFPGMDNSAVGGAIRDDFLNNVSQHRSAPGLHGNQVLPWLLPHLNPAAQDLQGMIPSGLQYGIDQTQQQPHRTPKQLSSSSAAPNMTYSVHAESANKRAEQNPALVLQNPPGAAPSMPHFSPARSLDTKKQLRPSSHRQFANAAPTFNMTQQPSYGMQVPAGGTIFGSASGDVYPGSYQELEGLSCMPYLGNRLAGLAQPESATAIGSFSLPSGHDGVYDMRTTMRMHAGNETFGLSALGHGPIQLPGMEGTAAQGSGQSTLIRAAAAGQHHSSSLDDIVEGIEGESLNVTAGESGVTGGKDDAPARYHSTDFTSESPDWVPIKESPPRSGSPPSDNEIVTQRA